jgi:hypothetical protein
MKEWVMPLLQKLPYWKRHYKEVENLPDNAVFYELVNQLQCNFGNVFGADSAWFTSIFGSVLVDLSEEVFKKIQVMKNVFFIFTPFPGAEVKIFQVEDRQLEGTLRIINFPYDSTFMSPAACRGQIAHELAHVFLEHGCGNDENKDQTNDQVEDQTDATAKDWGFEKEIRELRDYYKSFFVEAEE